MTDNTNRLLKVEITAELDLTAWLQSRIDDGETKIIEADRPLVLTLESTCEGPYGGPIGATRAILRNLERMSEVFAPTHWFIIGSKRDVECDADVLARGNATRPEDIGEAIIAAVSAVAEAVAA